MSNFSTVATVLSMILGLSVTRLLLGLVTVFRIRRQSSIDWIPLTWAAILFVVQLEFWWSINQLPSLKAGFSFQEFMLLVILVLMLFLSTALLLPNRSEDEKDGLRTYFEQDGRYALLSFAAFLIIGFVVNITLFQAPMMSEWAALDAPMILLPIMAFFVKSRRACGAITLVYIPLFVVDIITSLVS